MLIAQLIVFMVGRSPAVRGGGEVRTAGSATDARVMMRTLPLLLIAAIAMFAPAPAAAQRFNGNYPVCIQQWEWGGGNWISCRFTSWDECRANTVGLPAMCMLNPYVRQPPTPSRGPRPR